MWETYLEVNLSNIKYNLKTMRSLDKDAMFCAVLKADAYGLGAVKIAKEIESDIDYIAVARLVEAIELRKNNINTPILILGYVDISRINTCVELDIDIPIYGLDYAKKVNGAVNGKINCHLALDTGHGRIGFRDFEIEEILQLKEYENLNIISAFTHFATADEEDSEYTDLQKKKFDYIIDKVKDTFKFKFIHIANDAGAIHHNITKDMIRSGISMYGIYPSDYLKSENEIKLEQSFELVSSIALVKEVEKGTYISYGRTFQADKKMKVATIALGYADGYDRLFSNKGEMKINGKVAKVIGRVCMDQLMLDVTGIDCSIGDKVIVYPDIYKEANKISTIVYELMTSVNKRVPRVYKVNNQIRDNHTTQSIDL